MGGFFGTISTKDCVNDLFYGTDYNSHLGTKRAGLVTFDEESGFHRSIHSLERQYFRSRFEDELDSFKGHQGVGVISDTDPQPIIVNSHLGRYAVVTVAKINNQREIAEELLKQRMHFSEMSANNINQTELVALLINMGNSFVEGINKVYQKIEGSCSMLILTEDGIIAARDFLGRTPIVIGKKEIHRLSPIGTDEFIQSFAVTSETTSFPNLDYKVVRDLGPGEIIKLKADGVEVLQKPLTRCQICSFLWVYYGFPASDYQGINTEYVREKNGRLLGEKDAVIHWNDADKKQLASWLEKLEAAIRSRDSRPCKVIALLSWSVSNILMYNSLDQLTSDIRPLASVTVTAIFKQGDATEQRNVSRSFRRGREMLDDALIGTLADEAVKDLDDSFAARRPKGGQMSVVMAAGASGILLHEAMGHAFEADFNRKGQSIFCDRMGKRICKEGINIIDDGTVPFNRGALLYDDEGTPSQKTYMVRDGVLTSYLHDRISAAWYGVAPTGNGRRESFRYNPIPRMRCTYMESGADGTLQDLISEVK